MISTAPSFHLSHHFIWWMQFFPCNQLDATECGYQEVLPLARSGNLLPPRRWVDGWLGGWVVGGKAINYATQQQAVSPPWAAHANDERFWWAWWSGLIGWLGNTPETPGRFPSRFWEMYVKAGIFPRSQVGSVVPTSAECESFVTCNRDSCHSNWASNFGPGPQLPSSPPITTFHNFE